MNGPAVRAAVLLVGAVVLVLLVEVAGVRFLWVPLVLGLVLLAAAALSRSRGPLWAPGWVLTAVGLTEGLWFADGRPADLVLAQLLLVAAGTGVLLATATTRLGVRVDPAGLGLAVLLTGAFGLAEARAVPYVAGNAFLYAALLAAAALAQLPAARRAA